MLETSDLQRMDKTAASTHAMMTEWTQKNPKTVGSQAWERYELYKSSHTIGEAMENGCTWTDLRYDQLRGHLQVRPVVADIGSRKEHARVRGTMLSTKDKQHTSVNKRPTCQQATELSSGTACSSRAPSLTQQGQQGQRYRMAAATRRPRVDRACKSARESGPLRSNGLCPTQQMPAGHVRRVASEKEHQPRGQIQAACAVVQLPAICRSSLQTDQVDQGDCAICERSEHSVPAAVQQMVADIPLSVWTATSTAKYRHCRSLHFGLGLSRFQKGKLGRGTEQFSDLQAAILRHLATVQPDIRFSSFILNRYVAGDKMGKHNDRNMVGQSTQLVLIWGDFEGGDLVRYSDGGTPVRAVEGPATLLMDGNAEHEVTPITRGTRYSIVTYAKHTFPHCCEEVRQKLQQLGFPLPDIGPSGMLSQSCGSDGNPGVQLLTSLHDNQQPSLVSQLLLWFDHMCKCGSQTSSSDANNCELLRQMQTQRSCGEFCDIVLLVGKSKYSCHQCVLGASSQMMRTWLMEHDCISNAHSLEVRMDNVCSQSLGIVLDYMYGKDICAALHAEDWQCLWDVCQVAVAWGLMGLLHICKQTVESRVSELDTTTLQDALRLLHVAPSRRVNAKQSQC